MLGSKNYCLKTDLKYIQAAYSSLQFKFKQPSGRQNSGGMAPFDSRTIIIIVWPADKKMYRVGQDFC